MNRNVTRINMLSSVAAASLLMLANASTALAAPASETDVLTKTVGYSDLNLRSGAGAKVLYARIRSAAKDVCAPLGGNGLDAHVAWQNCVDRAIADSVTQVNSGMVTALHFDATKTAHKS